MAARICSCHDFSTESVSDWGWEIVLELNPEQYLPESGFESGARIGFPESVRIEFQSFQISGHQLFVTSATICQSGHWNSIRGDSGKPIRAPD